jgi:hypothetical protein
MLWASLAHMLQMVAPEHNVYGSLPALCTSRHQKPLRVDKFRFRGNDVITERVIHSRGPGPHIA